MKEFTAAGSVPVDRPVQEMVSSCLRSNVFWLAILLITALSLWLRQALPIEALGEAAIDDALFVKLARSLARGQWLGEYDRYTLSKGPGYPLFIALNFYLGLPLKLAEQLFYLAAAAALSGVMARWVGRWAALVTFVLIAFNPVQWTGLVRVLREGIYGAEALLLFALAARLFLLERGAPLGQPLGGRRGLPLALGATFAAYWLTREEGVWLLPSLGLMVLFWLIDRHAVWRAAAPRPRRWLLGEARYLGLPLAVVLAAIGLVNTLNWTHYGVWTSNDFARSPGFVAAYGAIARIDTGEADPLLLFTKQARALAYQVSPAARELEEPFETMRAAAWAKPSCTFAPPGNPRYCQEIISGFLPWALREVVTDLGYYDDARRAEAYYQRLATEVNAACDAGQLPCLPPRATLLPPLPAGWEGRIVDRLWPALDLLARFGGGWWPLHPSTGTPPNLRLFQDMTGGPLAPVTDYKDGSYVRGWVGLDEGRIDISLERRPEVVLPRQFHSSLEIVPRDDGFSRLFQITSSCPPADCNLVFRWPDKPPIVMPLTSLKPSATMLQNEEILVYIEEVGSSGWGSGLWTTGKLNGIRIGYLKRLSTLYAWTMPALAVAALLAFAVILGRDIRHRRFSAATILAAALLGAAALRVGLIAWIDATSFSAMILYYMSPAHPLLLAFIGLSLGAAGGLVMRRRGAV